MESKFKKKQRQHGAMEFSEAPVNLEKLRDYDAVNLSVPTSDTVVYSKNKLVQSIPNREEFF